MGSIVFRNRYWFYKSLYDDYLGRDFKLSFGLSCLLWMPHYWYMKIKLGLESQSIDQLRNSHPIKTILLSTILAETVSLTTLFTNNSKC